MSNDAAIHEPTTATVRGTLREGWAVVRPGQAEFRLYPSRAHAEAVAQANNFEYPALGPWTVEHYRQVTP
jgi:hypothetical protein